jgi:hypothetical protein
LAKKSKITIQKLDLLLAEMKKKQVDYFGKTQHNFMRDTDADGERVKKTKTASNKDQD